MKVKSSEKQNNALIENFPVKQQRYSYDCGICSLWCVLQYLKIKASYWDVYTILGPDQKDGIEGEKIQKVLKKLKIKFISEKSNISKLKLYSDNNYPSIVSIQHRKGYNREWKHTREYGHYAIVLKVTHSKIWLMDPKYGEIRWLYIKEFRERWHDADEDTIYRNYAITCIYN